MTSKAPPPLSPHESRKRKTTHSSDEDEDAYDDDFGEEGAKDFYKKLEFRKDRGTIGLRVVTWNLQGSEDLPKPAEFIPLAFPAERTIKAYALQEVKCLPALREALWQTMGGKQEFEIFEHWMGRATGAGSAGLTVLLVFAPIELVRTGQFRFARFQHVVKREVLNGQRFKFGLGSTSSRGAVSITFNFLDTTFSLCSLRVAEAGDAAAELALDVQRKDLDRILQQCCALETETWRRGDSLHHVIAAGSFLPSSSSARAPVSQKSTASIRKSFFRSTTTLNETSLLSKLAMETRERFPALDDYEEMDSADMAFDCDHVFFRSATAQLKQTGLKPLQCESFKIKNRAAVSTLFTLSGRGSDLLSLYSRITGNIPLHLSTRSNFHNVNPRRNKPTAAAKQKPKISTSSELQARTSERFLPRCTRCTLEISNEETTVPVTVEGNAYHLKCFTCDDCGQSLRSNDNINTSASELPFHEVDGRIYCPQSYEKLFVNTCAACSGALGEEFLVLPDGKRFHVSCYRCLVCSRPFATKQQAEHGDIVIEAAIPFEHGYMCELDFANFMSKRECAKCKVSFEYVVTVNGGDTLQCFDCFTQEYTSNCYMCKLGIDFDDEVLEYGGEEDGKKRCCHVSCLQCCVCKRSIEEFEDGAIFEYDNNTYCKRDYDQLEFDERCDLCDRAFRPGQERVETQGKLFHATCFHCAYCHIPLGSRSKQAFCTSLCDNKLAFWCPQDFAKYSRSACCARCDVPIEATTTSKQTMLGLQFHDAKCFTCSLCGKRAGAHYDCSLARGNLQCEECSKV